MTTRSSIPRRIAVFAAANAVHGALGALVAAVAAGLVFRELGAGFGIYALVTAAMLRLNLLDDSVGSYLVRQCSLRRKAAAEPIDAALGAAFVVAIGSAVVFALGVAVAVGLLLRAEPDAWRLGLLAGAGVWCASAANWGARWLEGYERYPSLRVLQSVANLVRLGGIAWLVQRGDATIVALVAWYAVSYALVAVPLLAFGRRVSQLAVVASMRAATRAHIRDVLRFARPLLFARGAAVLSYRLDLWIVQGIVGGIGAAAYAMADALAQVLTQALETFKVLLPISVNEWRADDEAWGRRFVLGTSKACVFVIGSLCLAAWANLDVLMTTWFGVLPDATAIAAQLLIGFVALTSFRTAVQTILIGHGKFAAVERSFLISAVLNVAVSVVATLSVGAWGPALGTLVSGVFLVVSVLPAATAVLLDDRGLLGTSVVVAGTVSLAVAAGASLLVGEIAPSGVAIGIAARSTVALVVYAIAFWVIALGRDERSWIRARLSFGAAR